MILKLSLNTQMIWMIFIETLKIAIEKEPRKILIVFDNLIAYMHSNKKLNPIVTELFIRGRLLYISVAFITQPYFVFPKSIRLYSTPYFIPKKRELQQTAFNH